MAILKNKQNILIFTIVAILIALFAYWIYQDDLSANGKSYPSKSKMCEHFAKSYLRTMKNEMNIDDFSGGNTDWARAIAIESEINNLCQLELTDEALENYSPSNIQKYLDEYRYSE